MVFLLFFWALLSSLPSSAAYWSTFCCNNVIYSSPLTTWSMVKLNTDLPYIEIWTHNFFGHVTFRVAGLLDSFSIMGVFRWSDHVCNYTFSTRTPAPDRSSKTIRPYLKANRPLVLFVKTGSLPVFNHKVDNISAAQVRTTHR